MNYDNEWRLPGTAAAAARASGLKSRPDAGLEFDGAILPSSEIELSATGSFSTQLSDSLVEKRQSLLFDLAGPVPVVDDEAVAGLACSRACWANHCSYAPFYRREKRIGRLTVSQSFQHVGRVAALLCHRAMTSLPDMLPTRSSEMPYGMGKQSTLQGSNSGKYSNPRQQLHRLRREPVARQTYERQKQRQRQDVSVDGCGLLVSQAHSYLATVCVTESGTDGKGVLSVHQVPGHKHACCRFCCLLRPRRIAISLLAQLNSEDEGKPS